MGPDCFSTVISPALASHGNIPANLDSIVEQAIYTRPVGSCIVISVQSHLLEEDGNEASFAYSHMPVPLGTLYTSYFLRDRLFCSIQRFRALA